MRSEKDGIGLLAKLESVIGEKGKYDLISFDKLMRQKIVVPSEFLLSHYKAFLELI